MKALFALLVTAAWTIVGTSIAIAAEASWSAFYIILIGIPCCLSLCIRSFGGSAGAPNIPVQAVTGSEVVFVIISTLGFVLILFMMLMSQMGDWRL
jgi:hypothetical protein